MRHGNSSAAAWSALSAALVIGLLLATAGCGLDPVGEPDLSGPSDTGVSAELTALPDVLNADGVSQSVRIAATPELTAGPTLAHTLRMLAEQLAPAAAPDAQAYAAYARCLQEAYAFRLSRMGDVDGARAPGCTTHFCVVDRHGNMAAVQTLLSIFGSRVQLADTGVLMNNGIMWFDPEPGQPNSLAPGKRCLTNYTPILGELGEQRFAPARRAGGASCPRLRSSCRFWWTTATPSRRRSICLASTRARVRWWWATSRSRPRCTPRWPRSSTPCACAARPCRSSSPARAGCCATDMAARVRPRSARRNSYLIEEFIMMEFRSGRIDRKMFTEDKADIILHAHCQQKAIASSSVTLEMLSIPLHYSVSEIPSGCCGMAGSFGYEMKDVLISIEIMDGGGRIERMNAEGIQFGYRRSEIPADTFILNAEINLGTHTKEEISAKTEQFLSEKRLQQPIGDPSAGCVFKNPPAVAAGKMIEIKRLVETCRD